MLGFQQIATSKSAFARCDPNMINYIDTLENSEMVGNTGGGLHKIGAKISYLSKIDN